MWWWKLSIEIVLGWGTEYISVIPHIIGTCILLAPTPDKLREAIRWGKFDRFTQTCETCFDPPLVKTSYIICIDLYMFSCVFCTEELVLNLAMCFCDLTSHLNNIPIVHPKISLVTKFHEIWAIFIIWSFFHCLRTIAPSLCSDIVTKNPKSTFLRF